MKKKSNMSAFNTFKKIRYFLKSVEHPLFFLLIAFIAVFMLYIRFEFDKSLIGLTYTLCWSFFSSSFILLLLYWYFVDRHFSKGINSLLFFCMIFSLIIIKYITFLTAWSPITTIKFTLSSQWHRYTSHLVILEGNLLCLQQQKYYSFYR